MLDPYKAEGFEWDEANSAKIAARGFSAGEIEEAFLNGRGTFFPDVRHSDVEPRYWLIGVTDDGRHVTVHFTLRERRLRPITAWTTARKYRSWVR